jgi:hypothetical protein
MSQTMVDAHLMTSPADDARPARKPRERAMAAVPSLEMLVGAHPAALRDLYLASRPADPTALGSDVAGKLLAVEPFADTFVATRPLVKLVARMGAWQGKSFESGGTSGRDRVLGQPVFRFRCEVTESKLDGEPTLVLGYHGLGNPWPISRARAELRVFGEDDAVALGPAWMGKRLLFWWGLDLTA